MVLQNIVTLTQSVPARMHFTDHAIENRTITDPVTLRPSPRQVLVFEVDRLNGQVVTAKFSTMAATLADQFAAYLPDKLYRGYEFLITVRGTGFQTKYTVEKIPISGR